MLEKKEKEMSTILTATHIDIGPRSNSNLIKLEDNKATIESSSKQPIKKKEKSPKRKASPTIPNITNIQAPIP